jgi:hypothetical protein
MSEFLNGPGEMNLDFQRLSNRTVELGRETISRHRVFVNDNPGPTLQAMDANILVNGHWERDADAREGALNRVIKCDETPVLVQGRHWTRTDILISLLESKEISEVSKAATALARNPTIKGIEVLADRMKDSRQDVADIAKLALTSAALLQYVKTSSEYTLLQTIIAPHKYVMTPACLAIDWEDPRYIPVRVEALRIATRIDDEGVRSAVAALSEISDPATELGRKAGLAETKILQDRRVPQGVILK